MGTGDGAALHMQPPRIPELLSAGNDARPKVVRLETPRRFGPGPVGGASARSFQGRSPGGPPASTPASTLVLAQVLTQQLGQLRQRVSAAELLHQCGDLLRVHLRQVDAVL